MHCISHTYTYAVCERDGLIESSFHKIIPLNSNHSTGMTVVGLGSMVFNAIAITHRS